MTSSSTNVKALLASLNTDVAGNARQVAQEVTSEKRFSQLLNQALGACKKRFMYDSNFKIERDVQGDLEEVAKDTAGGPVWAAFRKVLLTGEIPLDELWLSGEAMSSLKRILLHQGFSAEKVEQFVQKLFDDRSQGVKIQSFLKKLSRLQEQSDQKSPELMLEASVIPHVETLLRKFGIDPAETRKILNESRQKGKGLDLESLLGCLKLNLRKIHEKGSEGIKEASSDDAGNLLTRIGITRQPEEITGSVTLEKFVQMLKAKVNALNPYSLPDDQVERELKNVLQEVFVKDEETGSKGDRSVKDRGAQLFQTFLQKDIGEARSGKPGSPNSMTDKSNLAAWKLVQESSATTSGSEQHGQRETPQPGKQFSFSTLEQLVGLRETVTHGQRVEEKVSEAVDVKAGFIARGGNAAQTARPATESIPVHVVNQVGRRMGLALKNGQNEVKIRLKPPELGTIQLEMSMKDNVLKVAMLAENHSVKEMLMAHVSDLKQSLLQQGIELQKVDVEIDYNFGQSMADARKNLTGGRPDRGRPRVEAGSADQKSEGDELDALRSMAVSNYSVLDVFV